MPSTVSSVVSRPRASSTVMTPSLPTFSIASAIRSPISLSLFAEMAPTCAISFLPAVGTEIDFSCSTTAATAFSMPRLSAIGLAPAVTFLRPSRKIAWASTVAVVVPSPARSEVLVATSFTIWAPMFSSGSDSSTSFATVTPSLVTVGAPNFLSMTTFRPLGPSVTFTASASWSTPRLRAARASVLKWSSLAAIWTLGGRGVVRYRRWRRADRRSVQPPQPASADDGEDVALAENQELLAVDRDFGAAVLPVKDLVADLEVHRDSLALLEAAGADGDDLALLRLLLRGVRDIETTAHLLGLFQCLDDDAISQRADLRRSGALCGHRVHPSCVG